MAKQVEEKSEKLLDMLRKIDHCAITTDLWTSQANEAFLTVTCTFVLKEFKLRTAALSTNKLICKTNHTAQNIAESLQDVFNKWDISSKIVAIVTDNASSMGKCLK